MRNFSIKQNDTLPIIEATLYGPDNRKVDLTGCIVRFHMRQIGSSTFKIDEDAIVVDIEGVVQYRWLPADTDTIGEFEAEFEVTFPGGGVQTYPNEENIPITIYDDVR